MTLVPSLFEVHPCHSDSLPTHDSLYKKPSLQKKQRESDSLKQPIWYCIIVRERLEVFQISFGMGTLSLSSIVSWDSEEILHVFTKGQVKGVIVCFLPVDLFKNLCLAAHPSDMRVPQTRPKGKKTLTPSQTIEGDVPSLCISTPSFSPVFVT